MHILIPPFFEPSQILIQLRVSTKIPSTLYTRKKLFPKTILIRPLQQLNTDIKKFPLYLFNPIPPFQYTPARIYHHLPRQTTHTEKPSSSSPKIEYNPCAIRRAAENHHPEIPPNKSGAAARSLPFLIHPRFRRLGALSSR